MKHIGSNDLRGPLLRWLLPLYVVILLSGLVLSFFITLPNSDCRIQYSILIFTLLTISLIAYYFTLTHNYPIASYLLVFITFVGVWGAVYIASRAEVNKVITLVYVTIIILLSSLLLPPSITIVLALSHYIAVLIMVLSLPNMVLFNQVNILIYIFLASLFSVVSNYIISYQSRQFRQNAIKDHLTQLFNRRYFDETLDTLITRGSSKNETFGVILADIDNFKNYNDKFGHAVGDSALQLVANFLSTEVGLHNIVCRYGGDEFVILVPNATDKELIQLAERLNINVKQVDCSLENVKAPKITISMGLALFPHNGFTGEQLVFHADSQLLRAKEGGKDTIAFDHFGSTI